MATTTTQVYNTYRSLWSRAYERMIQRIQVADPRITSMHTHLTHNWGNDEAKHELEVGRRFLAALRARDRREYDAADHRQHVADGECGRYLWCERCQQST